jgi:hypothetical protein
MAERLSKCGPEKSEGVVGKDEAARRGGVASNVDPALGDLSRGISVRHEL